MSRIASLWVEVGADLRSFRRGLSDVDKASRTIGRSLSGFGDQLTVGVSAPLLALGATAFKTSNDFNSAMANVGSLIPGNVKRVGELKSAVQDMAIELGKSTDDLSGGLYQVISAFGDSADAVKILEINARSAKAGLATTADAINLTSAVTKAYGDTSAAAVTQVADLAQLTVKLGQTTLPELAASIGRVTPLTSEMGVAMQELFGTMATFTGVTGGAAEVSTQLRGVMQALMAPTESMADLFADLGVEGGKALIEQKGLRGAIETIVQAANASGEPLQKYITSIEGQTLALAASGAQSDTYRDKLGQMERAAGSVDEAFRAQTEGVNAAGFAWDQAKQKMTVAMQEIGSSVGPGLAGLAASIATVAGLFAALPDPLQSVVVGFGAFLVVLGPVLSLVGRIIAALPWLKVGFAALTGPIGLGVLAFGALVAAGVAIVNNWKVIKFEVGRLVDGIRDALVGRFGAIVDTVKEKVEAVTGFFSGLYDAVVGNSYVPDMVAGIAVEFAKLDALMVKPARDAAAAVDAAFAGIRGPKLAALGPMGTVGAIDQPTQGVLATERLDTTERVVNMFEQLLGLDLTGVMEGFSSATKWAGGALKDALGGVLSFAGNMAGQLIGMINPLTIVGTAFDQAIRDATGSMDGPFAESLNKIVQVLVKALIPVMEALAPVFDALIPIIEDLAPIISAVGQIFAALFRAVAPILGALVPLLRALFPVFKFVAIVATYLGQAFALGAQIVAKIFSAVAQVLGNVVVAIGKAIDKLPFVSGKGIIRFGEGLLDASDRMDEMAAGFGEAFGELGKAREEIKDIELDDPMSGATESINEMGDAAGNAAAALGALAGGSGPRVPQGKKVETSDGGSEFTGRGNIIVENAHFNGVQDPRNMQRQLNRVARVESRRGGVSDTDAAFTRRETAA